MKKILLLTAVLSVLASATVRAGTEAGMSEIQIQGALAANGNSENDDRDYSISVALTYNYFIASHLSFGGTVMATGMKSDPESGDGNEMGTLFFLGRMDLYLAPGESPVIPFIGVHGGGVNYTYTTSDDEVESTTTVAAGGQAGLKIFPTERTSWNLEGRLTAYKPDAEDDEEDTYLYQMQMLVGFSYYF